MFGFDLNLDNVYVSIHVFLHVHIHVHLLTNNQTTKK